MSKTGMMEIAFSNGIVNADAKTGMVDMSSLTKIGNMFRVSKGLNERSVQKWKEKEETKELICRLEEKFLNTDTGVLKVTKGRYGTTWCNMILAIDYAMWLDVDFKIEVIETFVNDKILDFRLLGIDHHKELNAWLDTLEDRIGKNNKGVYIQIAREINKACNGEFVPGWDVSTATAEIQQKRDKVLTDIMLFIEKGFIKTYEEVKKEIRKYNTEAVK